MKQPYSFGHTIGAEGRRQKMSKMNLNLLPNHQTIHVTWKAEFLNLKHWKDMEIMWGRGRLFPGANKISDAAELRNRLSYESKIIEAAQIRGCSISFNIRDFIFTGGDLSEDDIQSIKGLLERNRFDIAPLEHNKLLDSTQKGPHSQLTQWPAFCVLVGFALHRKIKPAEPGIQLMKDYFRNGGDFSIWFNQEFNGAVVNIASYFGANKGDDLIKSWFKSVSAYCMRILVSWGSSIGTKDPQKREKIKRSIEEETDRIWNIVISKNS